MNVAWFTQRNAARFAILSAIAVLAACTGAEEPSTPVPTTISPASTLTAATIEAPAPTVAPSPAPDATPAAASTPAPAATAAPVPPTASFSVDVTSGPAPLDVEFVINSRGTVTVAQWDFGDGNTSEERSPRHRYTRPGIYTVRLSVGGIHGTDESVMTVTCPPISKPG